MNLDFLKKKVFQVDGIQVTVGIVIAAVVIVFLLNRR